MDPIIIALHVLLALIPVGYLHSWGDIAPGTVIARVQLGWRERLWLHATALTIGTALLLLDMALRGPRPAPFLLAGCGLLLKVAVPLQLTVTD